MAFRGVGPEAVAEALDLSKVRAADWQEGLEAAYAWSGATYGTTVFVTPEIRGWVLCVGTALFGLAEEGSLSFGDTIALLSGQLGTEVQYFCTHRVVETHGWGRAVGGRLTRTYIFSGESGEKWLDVGGQSEEERDLGFAFFDPDSPEAGGEEYWEREDLTSPDEETVMKLAERWSLDPSRLEVTDPDLPAGRVGEVGALPGQRQARTSSSRREKPWWKFW